MAWPPGGSTIGHALVGNVAAKIAGGGDAVLEVIGIEHFLETDGDGFEVAPGQAAVGGESLR
jgi:hypothetical protein